MYNLKTIFDFIIKFSKSDLVSFRIQLTVIRLLDLLLNHMNYIQLET